MEHVTTIVDGHLRFIYSDEAAGLLEQGDARVERASHVEPAPGGGWYADMRPSGGPVLWANGQTRTVNRTASARGLVGPVTREGFKTRAEALRAEVAWLRQHRGL